MKKSVLFRWLLCTALVTTLITGHFSLGTTLSNALYLSLGITSLLLIVISRPPLIVFFWFGFLLINIFYFLFFRVYDPRAFGKLTSILLANITFYFFYLGAVKGWLTDLKLKNIFYFLLIVSVVLHFDALLTKRSDRGLEDVVVNTSYLFAYLLPAVFFIKSRTKSIFYIAVIVLMLFMGAKRGAIVVSTLVVLIWYVYEFFKLNVSFNTFAKNILASFLVILFSSVFVTYFLSKFSFIQVRLLGLLGGEGGSGRDSMYMNIIDGWANADLFNKFFGFGFSASKVFTGNNLYAHSDWLEALINFGILGVMVYGLFWWLCFKEIFNTKISRTDKAQLFSVIALCLVASLFSMVYPAYGSASLAIGLLGYLIGKSHATKKIN